MKMYSNMLDLGIVWKTKPDWAECPSPGGTERCGKGNRKKSIFFMLEKKDSRKNVAGPLKNERFFAASLHKHIYWCARDLHLGSPSGSQPDKGVLKSHHMGSFRASPK